MGCLGQYSSPCHGAYEKMKVCIVFMWYFNSSNKLGEKIKGIYTEYKFHIEWICEAVD